MTHRLLPLPTEHAEQVAFVNWWRQQFPDVLLFAIPNGEARSRGAAGRLKAEGVVPGVPDLNVPAWSLWIEMKRREGGTVTRSQKAMHERLRAIGHTVLVPRGANEARRQVLEFVKKGGSDGD